MSRRLLLICTIVLATAVLGINYVAWRWLFSVGVAAPLATGINLFWVTFDLLVFSVVLATVRYRVFDPAVHGRPTPPHGSSDAPGRADRVAATAEQHHQHTDQTEGAS